MSSRTHNRKANNWALHEVVFASRIVRMSVFCLLLSFLLQPIAPAYAAGDTVAVEAETVEELEPEVVKDEIVVESEPVPEESVVENEFEEPATEEVTSGEAEGAEELVLEEVNQSSSGAEDTTSLASLAETSTTDETTYSETEKSTSTREVVTEPATTTSESDTQDAATTGSGSDSSQDDEDVASTTDETTSDTASTTEKATTTNELSSATNNSESSESEVTENSSSIEQVIIIVEENKTASTTDDTSDEKATTTMATTSPVIAPVPSMEISDLNYYQFSKQGCVEVGDGSFYCSSDDGVSVTGLEDTLYAAVDAQGDKEIYLRISNEVLQLSDNSYDDDAPFYDQLSETVVWHRLINGRYQIVSYDLTTEKETLITNTAENNMEPSRSGQYIVWQRWVSGNWEIMLYDGNEKKQLTSNMYHDLAPHVRGEYIIWNTMESGERQAVVYDITTGLSSTIADDDGGQIKNPRFVLVYDTAYENGDVVTKGFDFESGEVVPLSAIPGELPDEIPSPDSTDETVALVQAKPTTGKDDLVVDDGVDAGSDDSEQLANDTNEGEEDMVSDLDLNETNDEVLELTEYDVIVPAYRASSTQEVDSASLTSSVE